MKLRQCAKAATAHSRDLSGSIARTKQARLMVAARAKDMPKQPAETCCYRRSLTAMRLTTRTQTIAANVILAAASFISVASHFGRGS